jgi:sugar O-acyltransferase (sialic acid O-acetyltransferase NeuD family)
MEALKTREIAVFGAGGFGLEVAMLIEEINHMSKTWDLIGFFDDGKPEGTTINAYPVLGGIEELNRWNSSLCLVLALGMPGTKKHVLQKIRNGNISFPTLIHPSVIRGSKKYLRIGEGSIICAGTILTTNILIGRYVILNLACTVGHETAIGDLSSFMPTCNISGQVTIGKENFWGTGAKIINNKNVGDDVIICAGAVVTDDMPDGVTAVGVPARIIKRRIIPKDRSGWTGSKKTADQDDVLSPESQRATPEEYTPDSAATHRLLQRQVS